MMHKPQTPKQKNSPAKLGGKSGAINCEISGIEQTPTKSNCTLKSDDLAAPMGGVQASPQGFNFDHLSVLEHGLVVLLLNSNKPLPRDVIEPAIGSKYAPNQVKSLRTEFGLDVPCTMVKDINRDGKTIRYGLYSFTANDRSIIAKGKGAAV